MKKGYKGPGLFGIKSSNRDFSKTSSWGKNQFNNSFPISLACYMESKKLDSVFLKLGKDLSVEHSKIGVEEVFGISPDSPNVYFAFESEFPPYNSFVIGGLPRIDVVVINKSSRKEGFLRALEIKFTALPDDQTSELPEDEYGCEIVVRPDTIVYLAISIANAYKEKREDLLKHLDPILSEKNDWLEERNAVSLVPRLNKAINQILLEKIGAQTPFVLQPIWKTDGKTGGLKENCLDVFTWSDFAFTRLFCNTTKDFVGSSIDRPRRTIIWLGKMLYEFAKSGKINHRKVIDSFTYGTKNDKAFSIGGRSTHAYMDSPELRMPRIKREEIKNIILGGGEKNLSPERRFDGAIKESGDLFS